MLTIVTSRPNTLIGVSCSPKVMLAADTVSTSLKMPQMDNVTTLVRFKRANSAEVIRKAIKPGKSRIPTPRLVPCKVRSSSRPVAIAPIPSTDSASTARTKNMIGANRKIEENGFAVAGWRSNSICVNDHRNPADKADDITRMKPRMSNSDSPKTIIVTPTVMTVITPVSFHDGFSRRKRNANIRTKPNEEDLHIAAYVSAVVSVINQEIEIIAFFPRTQSLDSLLKVSEMYIKLILPSPISKAVAAPQGPNLVK